MDAVNISQVALLIFWFSLAMLIFVLSLIARFYQSKANRPTFYRWYGVPLVAIGLATVRYVSLNKWGNDAFADLLMFAGGVTLIGLCVQLYFTMTSGSMR